MPGLTTWPQSTRGDDAVDAHLALLADRHFGDLADDRVIAFENRDAAAAACRKRFSPIALLGDFVEHAEEVGPMRQQRAAELVCILPGRVRQFVDVALHEEGVLRGADRAPEHHRHMGVLEHAADAQVGDLVGGGGKAFHRLRLDPAFNLVDAGRSQNRADGDFCIERRRHAVRPKRRLHPYCGLRPVAVVRHVLFARPHQLHRLADLLGDQDRLPHFVVDRAAPEAPAEEAIVDAICSGLRPEAAAAWRDRAHRRLRAEPDVELVGL